MSNNRASMIFGLLSWLFKQLYCHYCLHIKYCLLFLAIMLWNAELQLGNGNWLLLSSRLSWEYILLISQKRLPTTCLKLFSINSNLDNKRFNTHYCLYSIDTHFQKGAETILPSHLSLKATNTLIVYNNDHITFKLQNLQDQK